MVTFKLTRFEQVSSAAVSPEKVETWGEEKGAKGTKGGAKGDDEKGTKGGAAKGDGKDGKGKASPLGQRYSLLNMVYTTPLKHRYKEQTCLQTLAQVNSGSSSLDHLPLFARIKTMISDIFKHELNDLWHNLFLFFCI